MKAKVGQDKDIEKDMGADVVEKSRKPFHQIDIQNNTAASKSGAAKRGVLFVQILTHVNKSKTANNGIVTIEKNSDIQKREENLEEKIEISQEEESIESAEDKDDEEDDYDDYDDLESEESSVGSEEYDDGYDTEKQSGDSNDYEFNFNDNESNHADNDDFDDEEEYEDEAGSDYNDRQGGQS